MTTDLHADRLDIVAAFLAERGGRVLDLGCGDGELVLRLLASPAITAVTGVDIDAGRIATGRKRVAEAGGQKRARLIVGSLTDASLPLDGYDAAALVEAVEHIPPDRLSALERAVFGAFRPGVVIVTTPNADFNPLLGVPDHRRRHPDHRFEWSRARFADWARGVARRSGYRVEAGTIGARHPDLGGPSQIAVFRR